MKKLKLLLVLVMAIVLLVSGCNSKKPEEIKPPTPSGIISVVLSPFTAEVSSTMFQVLTEEGQEFPLSGLEGNIILLVDYLGSFIESDLIVRIANAFNDQSITVLYESISETEEAEVLFNFLSTQPHVKVRLLNDTEKDLLYKNKHSSESYNPVYWRTENTRIVDQRINLGVGFNFEQLKQQIDEPLAENKLNLFSPLVLDNVVLEITEPTLLVEFSLMGKEEAIYKLIDELNPLPIKVVPVVNTNFTHVFFPLYQERRETYSHVKLSESRQKLYEDWQEYYANNLEELSYLQNRWKDLEWYEDLDGTIIQRFNKATNRGICNIFFLDADGAIQNKWNCQFTEVALEDEQAYVLNHVIQALAALTP